MSITATQTPPPQPPIPPTTSQPVAPRRLTRLRPVVGLVVAISLVLLTVLVVNHWWQGRTSLSITDDAFVEAHIVNLAPEMVSGRIVRLLVDEDDRVERGQVVAEIDPVPYRDKVNVAASRLEAARRELVRQQADLARLSARCRSRSRSPGGPWRRRSRPIQGGVVGGAHRGRRREGDRRGQGRREGRQGRPAPGRCRIRNGSRTSRSRLGNAPGAGGIDPIARLRRGPPRTGRGQARQGDLVEDPGRGRPEHARRGRADVQRATKSVDLSETGQRPDPRGRTPGRGQGGRRRGGPAARWSRPSTTWRTRKSEPRSPASWSGGTATSATSPRRASRC